MSADLGQGEDPPVHHQRLGGTTTASTCSPTVTRPSKTSPVTCTNYFCCTRICSATMLENCVAETTVVRHQWPNFGLARRSSWTPPPCRGPLSSTHIDPNISQIC